MDILRTENLTKHFGGLAAITEVNLTVEQGTLHSIIGPNGAGKTTLFNMLSGHIPPSMGRIKFNGSDVTGFPVDRISSLGMGRSFQLTSIFHALSVFENVRVAVQAHAPHRFNMTRHALEFREPAEKAIEILEEIGLANKALQKASTLSHGDQRVLEVGIALATKPILLLLDEPTSGMSPEETGHMMRFIRNIGDRITILLIEHDMRMVMTISDRVTVLNMGQIIAEGTPGEIQQNMDVKKAYLGDYVYA
jgi:branched-chain amino acid transport system ATP-binding protein